MKNVIYLFVSFILVLSPVLAHDESSGGELKFIRGYTLEMSDTLSFSISLNGTVLKPTADLEIYKNGNLVFSSDMKPEDDGHYIAQYNISGGFYEFRPFFHVGNDIISAQFSQGEPQKSSAPLWIMIVPAIGIAVGIVRKIKVMVGGSLALIVILGIVYAYVPVETTKTHEHADFAVFLNGEQYDFSQERFMTFNNTELSELVDLHDMKGNIIHKHAKGITLGYFFGTLGIKFSSTCFVAESEYCGPLKMFVNGQPNYDFGDYKFNDLDRILISYGDETEEQIANQISSVGTEACIQSGKCPERGTATDETCSAGKCE
ncbi:MAG TPA: hypothetical protein VJH04_00675 [archaeon]|nr:hypothetical protein [archaeon]